MRKPRDFDSELKALADKAKALRDRRVRQLGELVTATGVSADNLAGWDPTLQLTLPAGADPAAYAATVTYSVC